MKMKNLKQFFSLAIIIILFSSCDFVKGIYETPAPKNNGLIAEVIETSEELEEAKTVEALISEDKGFSTLSDILDLAELDEKISGESSFTIFAPVNVAFEKLPEGTSEKLLNSEDKKYLQTLLNSHILPREVNEEDLIAAIKNSKRGSIKLKTLNGSILTAMLKGNSVFLIDKNGNGGKLVTTDVEASNGLIHTIDAVMMPKMR